MAKKIKMELIYEKLAPGEVLIISKDKNGCLEVAENEKGKVKTRIVRPVKENKKVKKQSRDTVTTIKNSL